MRVTSFASSVSTSVALWAALTLNFAIPRLMPGQPGRHPAGQAPAARRHGRARRRAGRTSSCSAPTPTSRCGASTSATWATWLHGDLGISVSDFPGQGVRRHRRRPALDRRPGRRRHPHRLRCSACCWARSSAGGAVPGWTRWSRPRRCWPPCRTSGSRCSWPTSGPAARLVPALGGYDVALTPGLERRRSSAPPLYHGVAARADHRVSSVGGWLLGMRNMMVSTLAEDYVLTAEAKGLRAAHGSCRATPPATPSCPPSPGSPSRSASWSPARSSPSRSSPTPASAATLLQARAEQRLRADAGHLPVHHPRRARRQPRWSTCCTASSTRAPAPALSGTTMTNHAPRARRRVARRHARRRRPAGLLRLAGWRMLLPRWRPGSASDSPCSAPSRCSASWPRPGDPDAIRGPWASTPPRRSSCSAPPRPDRTSSPSSRRHPRLAPDRRCSSA